MTKGGPVLKKSGDYGDVEQWFSTESYIVSLGDI